MARDQTERAICNERAKREADDYDARTVWAASTRLQAAFPHVFHCPNTRFGENHFGSLISRSVPGACVLDYGCFDGCSAAGYRKLGPRSLVAIDISPGAIETARANHPDAADFRVMDGHSLAFVDGTFDTVIGNSILHHLDFEVAISEICRVLKPGGTALFSEPLHDNPLGKLIRACTPSARTADERPLTRRQIQWADDHFGSAAHVHTGLFSTAVALASSRLVRSPDNIALVIADKVDRVMMRTPLRWWMRRIYLVWRKLE